MADTAGDGQAGAEAADPAQQAAAKVERLHNALIENMIEAEDLGYEGREENLAPVVSDSFDAAFMMRVATGRFWKDFSEAQRETLVDTFVRLTIATYAARFDEFSGQKFVTLGAQEGRGDRVLVKTNLIKANGEPIAFNYMMKNSGDGDDGWRIQDIFLRGTSSQLAIYRSEYTSVLENKGYDSLISTMEGNIKSLSGQDGG